MNIFIQCFVASVFSQLTIAIAFTQFTSWMERRTAAVKAGEIKKAHDQAMDLRMEYLARRWKTGTPVRLAGWVVAPLVPSEDDPPTLPDDVEYQKWENACMSMLLGNDTDHLTNCPMCDAPFHPEPDGDEAPKVAAAGEVA